MNSQSLNVHHLPAHVAEGALKDSVVVVVDLLRASTTICQALASGATEVVPFLEVADALAAAERVGRASVVLGGERKGGKIPGFDLGNSPSEYTPAAVGGRCVYMTTTNGTRALTHARAARRIVIGALVNLSTVVASLRDEPRIDVLCAGTDGKETFEDVLAAGAIVCGIQGTDADNANSNEAARDARNAWELLSPLAKKERRAFAEHLALELRETQGGRNLLAIGLDADLVACAQIDKLQIAPELDVANWRITAK
jgi:2-phosphosulfolactate phosphatase